MILRKEASLDSEVYRTFTATNKTQLKIKVVTERQEVLRERQKMDLEP